MMLDMFVERKRLSVRRRVVGLEEREVKVMLFDGDVEDETDAAHSN